MSFELHADLQRDGIVLGRFPLCMLLLINDRNYPWFVLVPQRSGLRELIDLEHMDYQTLWQESAELSRGLQRIFRGDKLNVAALGNVTPQLHIHHIVRFSSDPSWPAPIWGKLPMQPYTEQELEGMREKFQAAQWVGLRLG